MMVLQPQTYPLTPPHIESGSHISPQVQLRMWLIKLGSISVAWLFRQYKDVRGQGKLEREFLGLLTLSAQNAMTWRGDASSLEEQWWVHNREGVLSSLVFIDLPLSIHSKPASEARQGGVGLAPQESCEQKTMKLETLASKKKGSSFNVLLEVSGVQ